MSDELGLRIDELTDQAAGLEYGTAKVALLEEAVRLADLKGDTELGYQTRQALIDAATFAGQYDQTLVAFSWCLAQADREPDRFSEMELLWKYKWILGNILEFSSVRLEQVESMLDDMESRYTRAGSTLRAVRGLRADLAQHRGDRSAAAGLRREFQRTPRDWLSDCRACELDGEVDYLLFLNQYARAVDRAGPILGGLLSCGHVPHRTYGRLLIPLVKLDRVDEAAAHHAEGYRLLARNPGPFIYQLHCHLTFLVLTDNLPRAVKFLEKHLPDALAAVAEGARFHFFLAATFLLDRLAASGQETIRLRLPERFPLQQAGNRYRTADLSAWFAGQARTLAERFDARNGTDHWSRKIPAYRRLRKLVRPYPLDERRGSKPP